MTEYTTKYIEKQDFFTLEEAVRLSILKWEWLASEVGHKRMRTLVDAGEFMLGTTACPLCTWWNSQPNSGMCIGCPGYDLCLEQFSFAKAMFNAWRLARKDRELKWEQFQLEAKAVLQKLSDILEELD